jgi:hypothetical protein
MVMRENHFYSEDPREQAGYEAIHELNLHMGREPFRPNYDEPELIPDYDPIEIAVMPNAAFTAIRSFESYMQDAVEVEEVVVYPN